MTASQRGLLEATQMLTPAQHREWCKQEGASQEWEGRAQPAIAVHAMANEYLFSPPHR